LKYRFSSTASAIVFASAAIVSASAASAQFVNFPKPTGTRVTATFQIQKPSSALVNIQDSERVTDSIRRSLQTLLDHECDALEAVLKGPCRVVQLNVGTNMNQLVRGSETFGGTASATFQIDDAAAAETAAPK
jgi:hypothetical protein